MNTARLTRRSVLGAALAAAAAPALASSPWPAKPVRIITPAPAGISGDVFARHYAEQLGKALGVPVIVENRPGAAMIIGVDAVAKAPADGHTLLYGFNSAFTMNPALYAKLPYDARKDLSPVVQNVTGAYFLVAHPGFPARNLKELLEQAKAKPGSIPFASYGPGSAAHLGFEWLQDATGVQLNHVPFKSGAIQDVLAGHVPLMLEAAGTALPHLRTGKLKALAYTAATRHPLLADVPTVAETVPGFELTGWHGFWVPAGTPAAVVQRLNAEINRITRTADMQRRITEVGFEPATSTPEETATAIAREGANWSRLIRAKGIRLD